MDEETKIEPEDIPDEEDETPDTDETTDKDEGDLEEE